MHVTAAAAAKPAARKDVPSATLSEVVIWAFTIVIVIVKYAVSYGNRTGIVFSKDLASLKLISIEDIIAFRYIDCHGLEGCGGH